MYTMQSCSHIAHRAAHRPLRSSFLGLPDRVLNIHQKKKLLRGLRMDNCTSVVTQDGSRRIVGMHSVAFIAPGLLCGISIPKPQDEANHERVIDDIHINK